MKRHKNTVHKSKNSIIKATSLAPQGYKTFFMLNSSEYEVSIAHKNQNAEK